MNKKLVSIISTAAALAFAFSPLSSSMVQACGSCGHKCHSCTHEGKCGKSCAGSCKHKKHHCKSKDCKKHHKKHKEMKNKTTKMKDVEPATPTQQSGY